MATSKVDVEHIRFLTEIFQEIRIIGYDHDYEGDYKLIGNALKKTKNYNMVQIMDLLEYFKKHGLKNITSMSGWLIWAFKNPQTAMQPFNTIDLAKVEVSANERREAVQATDRNYYDQFFQQ